MRFLLPNSLTPLLSPLGYEVSFRAVWSLMNLVAIGVQYTVIFVDLLSREILSDRQTWVNFVVIIRGNISLTQKRTRMGDFWQKLIVNESVDKRLHVSFVSERRAMSLIHDHKFYWWILIRNNHWSILVGKHTVFIMTSMKVEFCRHTRWQWNKKGGGGHLKEKWLFSFFFFPQH